jgi:hypothetical protein
MQGSWAGYSTTMPAAQKTSDWRLKQVGGLSRPFGRYLTPSESFSFDASHELSRVGVQRFCEVTFRLEEYRRQELQ